MATALPTTIPTGTNIHPLPRPSLPRAVALALTDSAHSGDAWDAEEAMREITAAGQRDRLPMLAEQFATSLAAVDRAWLDDRLSLAWLAMGHSKSGDVATAWLSETARLLADIPQDIVSEAIDEAIKASDKGFLPSVGAIRKFADPLVAKRKRVAARLARLISGKPKPMEAIEPPVEVISIEEIRAMTIEFRRMGLAKGWITQAQIDEAFPSPTRGASDECENSGRPGE